MPRRFFVGGNFKMNGSTESIKKIIDNLNSSNIESSTEVVIAPPAIYLTHARSELNKKYHLAAQNVSDKPEGALTGEIAVSQLRDVGVSWTILGHSERRTLLNETDEMVASKTKAAVEGGLGVVLCCGETLEQREKNQTINVVTSQLRYIAKTVQDWKKIVVAYEPIWAIGTGKVATTEQAQEVHAAIRKWLGEEVGADAQEETRIIYGGSVSDSNCRELAKEKDIDGFLVGGASLKPAFVQILNAKSEEKE